MATKKESAPQFDLDDILGEVRGMYAKDKKSQSMLSTGNVIKQSYTLDDGCPIPEGHPLRELIGAPVIPFNKIYQFAGNEDTGKSTMIGELVAAAQKNDWLVILWDAEDKFDANRLRVQFGGDPDRLLLIKTNEILQGGEKVRKFVNVAKAKYPNAKILICWDSVGGSQSRSHAERELDNEKHAQPGQDAKENGSVMKMLVSLFNKYPDSISVILANQVYAKIGFMQHGDKESGGKKVAYHSSVIIILKRIKVLTKQVNKVKMKYGIITRATVQKNHISQGENSVHQLDFEITAKGAARTDAALDIGDDDEE